MYTCNPNTDQAETEAWVWPDIQPCLLGKLQTGGKTWLKMQGGQYLENETSSGPLASTHMDVLADRNIITQRKRRGYSIVWLPKSLVAFP